MARGRTERGSRQRARAASVVVPFPRGEAGDRLDLVRFVPSGRSLALGFAIVAGVLAAYWGARVTSVFAVQEVAVQGAAPAVERDVRVVAGQALGSSLLTVDPRAIEDAVRALPSVAAVSVDRAFPHTLIVKVAPERAVAVARRRDSAWLVTGSGEVVRQIAVGTERSYPRLWLRKDVAVRLGGTLPASFAPATRALEAARDVHLPRRVKGVRTAEDGLTLVLRRGPELRLGGATDLRLKLTVAGRVLPLLEHDSAYLDVSVPERPVAGTSLNS
ncbi:MAG: cell division protein FtsQ/DivIB [Gaiellaceae bacterium]